MVAALLKAGLDNRSIAARLAISYHTARRYSSRVSRKLNIKSTAMPCMDLGLRANLLPTIPSIAARLTNAEIGVLALICQGESSKAIARTLGISSRTVDKHRQHLFKKTGTDSARMLAAWVAQQYAMCGIAGPISSD